MMNIISVPKTVNTDLQNERAKANFGVEDFAIWWHGDEEKLKFKRDLETHVLDGLKDDDYFQVEYKNHVDTYNVSIKRVVHIVEKLRKLQEERNPGGKEIWPGLYDDRLFWGLKSLGDPFGVHFSMVLNALKVQGTDEQWQRFGVRAEKMEIICTYAQTELGHGTYIRGMETTACYDHNTEEFILNTPTITAYKWWPGGLASTVNYCLLVANLYVDNICHGLAMFMLQLRDEQTHQPLAGITVGEIGRRWAYVGYNNGYLGLNNVRIPRNNMLMRNVQVQRDGTVVKNVLPVLTYATMVYVRTCLIKDCTQILAMACTIAIRYSAVRRQGCLKQGEPECQIIDYVMQQKKLFTQLAACVAFRFLTYKMSSLYEQVSQEIAGGEYSRLSELHALSCITKVLCTTQAAHGVELMRLACGGVGLLVASNFLHLYVFATASCTYEGDNTVLALQVGRFLMKSWKNMLQGHTVASSLDYMLEFINQKDVLCKCSSSWLGMLKALQYTSACKTQLAFDRFTKCLNSGLSLNEALNITAIEQTKAAELYGYCFIVKNFIDSINQKGFSLQYPSLKKVISDLVELYMISIIYRYMNDSDIVRFIDLNKLNERFVTALTGIRRNAVSICDGFDFHDRLLASILGCYDGNVYERIFVDAQKNPLNKQLVQDSFCTHLRPFLKSNI